MTPEMQSSGVRYSGTKTLTAWPMTRGEYNSYRTWTPPEGEDQTTAGFLVEYADGGKPNDSRHEGYISWSPADVFERSYRPVRLDAPNPLTQHLAVTVCGDADDAIAKGFDWKAATPPVKPIEVRRVVVVRAGTEAGNASVDFLLEDETGQRFVFMVTGNLLKSIPC